MAKYLIDANLPYYFGLWNNKEFIHVKDIDDSLSDEQIWDFAKQNNLIIISKDADFSLKVLIKGFPPKVIHLKFGNLKMSAFHDVISKNWSEIENRIEEHNISVLFNCISIRYKSLSKQFSKLNACEVINANFSGIKNRNKSRLQIPEKSRVQLPMALHTKHL